MSSKSTQIFLLAGAGRKDPRHLQKTIPGEHFVECDPVHIGHLKETLRHSKGGDPDLILLDDGSSAAILAKTLSRVRKIASGLPVLVLPKEWNALGSPALPDASKSQSRMIENHRRLTRFLRNGWRRTQMQTELTRLALCDDLTGLYNRRGFLILGSQALKMAFKRKKNLLLFFADLDNLKKINDQFGHQEGDRALSKVAEIFRKTFRTTDITARFGGDEFAALVIEDSEQTTRTISRRLRRNLADCAAKERSYLLSFSVGTAQCLSSGRPSLQRLLATADHSLYEQKRTRCASTRAERVVPFPEADKARGLRRLTPSSTSSFVNLQTREFKSLESLGLKPTEYR